MSTPGLLHLYCVIVELLTHTKCFSFVLEVNRMQFHSVILILNPSLQLSLSALSKTSAPEVMMIVIDTLRRHLTVWMCMRSTGTICTALYTAHQAARTRGIMSRALLSFLVEIDAGRHLDVQSREHILLDIATHVHVRFLSFLSFPSR